MLAREGLERYLFTCRHLVPPLEDLGDTWATPVFTWPGGTREEFFLLWQASVFQGWGAAEQGAAVRVCALSLNTVTLCAGALVLELLLLARLERPVALLRWVSPFPFYGGCLRSHSVVGVSVPSWPD